MHCTKQNVYGHYSEHIIIYSFLCQAEKRLRPEIKEKSLRIKKVFQPMGKSHCILNNKE